MKNIIRTILAAFLSLSMSVGNVYAMSSNNYSVQIDSVNFGGGNSSSASYGLESTQGEVGAGDLTSASFKTKAGYQQQFEADTTDPSIPSNLVATAISSSRIDLSWNASTDNIVVSGYRIFRDGQILGTTTSITYSDIGLTASTTYTYEVEAFDSSLNYSGLSASAVATTSGITVTPESPQGNSSGSIYPGFIGTALQAVNPIDFTAVPQDSSILLSWKYPLINSIASVTLVRSSSFYPSSVNDGEVVFVGNATSFIDTKVKKNERYYYALFAQDVHGNYSSGVLAFAMISDKGEVSETPFEDVVVIDNVDPIIARLTLLDFDFIQDDIKIHTTRDTVPIDGSKNLLIRLDYRKVPEILKTIAITLRDPDDDTKVFTFLLRVNKDKTAYEATIAPLGKNGLYKMNVTILDYKNQGLKQLQGSLKALSLEEIQLIIKNKGWGGLLGLIISVIVLAVIALIFLRTRKKND